MRVEVYHPQKNVETFEHAASVIVPTPYGEKGFLPHHMTFMGGLSKGVIKIQASHLVQIPIEKGYVHFEDNICKLFVIEN